jgi:hypothetical protein
MSPWQRTCCAAGEAHLVWINPDTAQTLAGATWCLNLGGPDEPEYVPVAFCPWCGRTATLPEPPAPA